VNVEEARLCRQPPVVHYCRFILLCVQNGGREGTFLSFIAALFFCGTFFWRLNNNNNRCDGCVGELDSCNTQWIVVSHPRSFFACEHYCAWQTKLGVMKSFQWEFESVCASTPAVFAHAKRDNFSWTSPFRSFTVLGCHKANQILGPKSTLKSMILGVNLKSW
jgi:hypothetical protein